MSDQQFHNRPLTDYLSEEAAEVYRRAQKEAARQAHDEVYTDDLLLAFIHHQENPVAFVLDELGLGYGLLSSLSVEQSELEPARKAVRGRMNTAAASQLKPALDLRGVMELARQKVGSDRPIETWDLMFALLVERDPRPEIQLLLRAPRYGQELLKRHNIGFRMLKARLEELTGDLD